MSTISRVRVDAANHAVADAHELVVATVVGEQRDDHARAPRRLSASATSAVDEALHVVALGLDVDGQAVLPRRLARHGPDRHHAGRGRQRGAGSDQEAHRGAGGEGHVGRAAERRALVLSQRLRQRLVERHDVHLGAALPQRLGQHVARLGRSCHQHAAALHRHARERLHQRLGHEALRHDVGRGPRGGAAPRPCRVRSPRRWRPRARGRRLRSPRAPRTAAARRSGSSGRRARSRARARAPRAARHRAGAARCGSRGSPPPRRRAARRCAARPLAWARARVTATTSPWSGRRSSHAIVSRSSATGPMSVIAGGRTSSSATRAAMSRSGPVTTRWPGSVPRATTAAGSAGSRPAAIRRSAISGSVRMPM